MEERKKRKKKEEEGEEEESGGVLSGGKIKVNTLTFDYYRHADWPTATQQLISLYKNRVENTCDLILDADWPLEKKRKKKKR